MRIGLAMAAIGSAWVLLWFRVEPAPTWFYVLAWYPTLVLLDAVACRIDGRPSLLAHPRFGISALAWSAVIWLIFEAANFRLENWYYVLLPARAWERWAGILLSFATVLPAILLAQRVLDGAGLFRSRRVRPLIVGQRGLRVSVLVGLGATLLALAAPQHFFPLIWGAVFFAVDPFVYRHARHLSLIGDMERGDWGRIGRLMMGGLAIGIVWETYNYGADGSWIYTVPWLEQLKLFEMPPLGFLGFPFFALEAWSMYSGLCALGVAVPLYDPEPVALRPRRTALAGVCAVLFAVVVLFGMERFTISSVTPRLVDLPGTERGASTAIEAAGITSPRDLARMSAATLAARTALARSTAASAIASARLVTLRGIGTRHARRLDALGIRSVCALATWQPADLWLAYHRAGSGRPAAAEVRVWTRAAKRSCAGENPVSGAATP